MLLLVLGMSFTAAALRGAGAGALGRGRATRNGVKRRVTVRNDVNRRETARNVRFRQNKEIDSSSWEWP